MNIDFHHGTTYVVARLAGFSTDEARIVAHASQYVDDAVSTGVVTFTNGAMYSRISSAHKMLDYRNFEALADHLVWVPFHFLPGNGGLPAGEDPDGPFIKKLVTTPDSPVARDLIKNVIEHRTMRHALHRLGIAMHVYADTWAHQGFAGVGNEINHATVITGPDGGVDRKLMDRIQSYFINKALPLGHGTVLGNPDKPYLIWGYTNGLGETKFRNNPVDFVTAADAMCKAMRRFRAGDADLEVPGIPSEDKRMITSLFLGTKDPDENARHAVWLGHIKEGAFSFGADEVSYIAEGPGSWKHAALGGTNDQDVSYKSDFLRSDWKLFHDALQAHRLEVVNHILPEYGICAA